MVGRGRPRFSCGDKTSYLTSRCSVSVGSILNSWKETSWPLRWCFCLVHSSVWRVIDLISGRSCRVGSLGRLWLNIHSLLLVCEESQITRRAKSVIDYQHCLLSVLRGRLQGDCVARNRFVLCMNHNRLQSKPVVWAWREKATTKRHQCVISYTHLPYAYKLTITNQSATPG